MRTTIDLPDDLYRTLKARAAFSGVPVRQVLQDLIEQGLRASIPDQPPRTDRREPLPVIIAARGRRIPAMSPEELRRLEEEEDEAKYGRST